MLRYFKYSIKIQFKEFKQVIARSSHGVRALFYWLQIKVFKRTSSSSNACMSLNSLQLEALAQ